VKKKVFKYILGFFWREIKQAYNDGIQDYLLSWNNIVDSCTSVLYMSSFALKYYVIYRVSDLVENEFISNSKVLIELFSGYLYLSKSWRSKYVDIKILY
jgi:hypothetical protein